MTGGKMSYGRIFKCMTGGIPCFKTQISAQSFMYKGTKICVTDKINDC